MRIDYFELVKRFEEFQDNYITNLHSKKEQLHKCFHYVREDVKRIDSYHNIKLVGSVDSSFKSTPFFLSRLVGTLVTVSDIFDITNGNRDTDVSGAFLVGYDQSVVDALLRGLSTYFEVFTATELLDKADIVLFDRRITSTLIGAEQAVSVASRIIEQLQEDTQEVYDVSDYLLGKYPEFLISFIRLLESGRVIFTSKVSKSVELVNYLRNKSGVCDLKFLNDYEVSYMLLGDGEYISTDLDMAYSYVPGAFIDDVQVKKLLNRVISLSKGFRSVFLNVWGKVYKFESADPLRDTAFVYNSFVVQKGNEFPFLDLTDTEAKANLRMLKHYIPEVRVW
ncbi:MAG: hypothetical protein QXX30_00905 [Candidatus Aenigmatarchaeota archaeon]